jgi:hypothetical protein
MWCGFHDLVLPACGDWKPFQKFLVMVGALDLEEEETRTSSKITDRMELPRKRRFEKKATQLLV